ncbi:MAG TPA: DUF397 domain-containing protein [Streptosporangiaceae bacterium]|jgi:hypothetical protein|nr:DUF397 domain-containing protein [Streptosporangiaceae bacterium]
MTKMDLTGAIWHKSGYSSNGGDSCVEVAFNLPGIVAVRDSKDSGGPILSFTEAEWIVFTTGVRSGHYDTP